MAWRSYPTETGIRWTDDSGNDISDAQWQSEGGSNNNNNNNGEWYNPALQNAAYQAGQLAAQQKRMELIDVPMLELQKQQAIMQAALAAVNGVLQANLGAGNMALTAGNMGLSAAQLGSQEALGALGIAAGLRGPSNAFQQQESMHGLNAAGLSNAVGAIAGKYTLPGFKAPQAAPEGATLGTMARDFQGAGGYGSAMAPSDYARMYADRAYQDAQRYGQGGINAAQDFYGRYGPNAQGGMAEEQALDAIWAKRPDLKAFYAAQPEWAAKVNTPEGQREIVRNWISTADPQWRGKTALQVAQAMGIPIQQQAQTTQSQGGVGGGQPGMGQYGENYGGPTGWQPGMPVDPNPANPQSYKPSYSTSAAEYAKALPTPNKISGKAWLGLDQDSRDFLTSAYESPELGYSANYVNDQIRRGLPGFRAPSVGRVA